VEILRCEQITKYYKDLEVLKGVDLTVEAKEIVSIVGSSGAGKSTLLHLLGTLDKPDSGSLRIQDQDPFSFRNKKLAQFRNKNIGFVFQFHNLLPELTALENAMLPGIIAGDSKQKCIEKATQTLDRLGLSDRLDNKPFQLSGGEQQRVSVARAIHNNPSIILADEPSGNLDSKNAQSLHEMFFQLREELGLTFIIVTHNEALAKISDRKIIMKDGLIVEQ
jgi:lipoprotein-releasing system ATP-binding protein